MGNKVKYNLKNVHAAKLTETVVEGVRSYNYAAPRAIPGAVSLSLDAEGESTPFYADGIVYFRSTTNNGYSGDLEMALIPDWFRTEILQEILDKKGVLVERSTNKEAVKFALLFVRAALCVRWGCELHPSRHVQLHIFPSVHRVRDQGRHHRARHGETDHRCGSQS